MSEQSLIAMRADPRAAAPGALTSFERGVSLTAGTALILNGLRRGGISGALQAVIGAYGLFRGATGQCALKRVLTPTPFEERFSAEHDWRISEALTRSVTINRPLEDIKSFIAKPQNIGPLLRWVDSVEEIGADTTCWTMRAPAGRTLHWTLVRVESQHPSTLHWRTPDRSRWQHDVSVQMSEAPAGRGTQVKVIVVCKPCLGKIGYGLARAISVFSDKALLNALQAVKQQLETGEVATNRLHPDDDHDFFTCTVRRTMYEPKVVHRAINRQR
jgi:uncharacterized membrane protein